MWCGTRSSLCHGVIQSVFGIGYPVGYARISVLSPPLSSWHVRREPNARAAFHPSVTLVQPCCAVLCFAATPTGDCLAVVMLAIAARSSLVADHQRASTIHTYTRTRTQHHRPHHRHKCDSFAHILAFMHACMRATLRCIVDMIRCV